MESMSSNETAGLGQSAIGTWSGGRFLHFGEAIPEERLIDLLTPGRGIDTVMTADAYGVGEADEVLGKAIAGTPRDDYRLIGAIGHDFYNAERDGPRGFPRFTSPDLRGPDGYADYLEMATDQAAGAARAGPTRPAPAPQPGPHRLHLRRRLGGDGRPSGQGLTDMIGVAPGPANGFTLDLLDCFDRFGDTIDWAMIILNPFEPWPGSYVLDAAAEKDIKVLTRVVDYGGLFWDILRPGAELGQDRPSRLPSGRLDRGRGGEARPDPPDRRPSRPDPACSSPASGTSPTRRSSASPRP